MEYLLLELCLALLITKRSVIAHNYGRVPFGVTLIILLSSTAPALLFINALDKPLVVVSPSDPIVALPAPGGNNTQDALVGSVYADSWSIYLTTSTLGQNEESQLLIAYINNSLGP